MAQTYVSGPVPIWISDQSGLPQFFGHCERMPNIKWRPNYSEVFVDIGGVKVPFDTVKQGSDAMVSLDMIRFNYPVYNNLSLMTCNEGTVPGDLGTLMVYEQDTSQVASIELWLPFPYVAKPAMGTMSPGYHFLAAMCINDDLDQMGTVPLKKRIIFHCLRQFDPFFTNDFGAGSFDLFDDDMSAIAGLPIN